MIIKKLAVPLVNDKVLAQAEHCYIATSAISEAGFDFIRTRLSPKCKIDIVTGLDGLTSPDVLKRIWKHYQDRMTFRIYTRNFFNANTYIFDLPYRKAVAFTGSGSLTLEGLKDHEEMFCKTTDAKEIEAMKSWFTGYFEFAEALDEQIIQQYEALFPLWKQREIASRKEKNELIKLTTAGFSWDTIKFKNQYFVKEDYLAFSRNENAAGNIEAHERVKAKLTELYETVARGAAVLKLHVDPDQVVIAEQDVHLNNKVRSMAISFGRSDSKKSALTDFMILQAGINQLEFFVRLSAGSGEGKIDREYFMQQMNAEEYRKIFLNILKALGPGYWIEIFGSRRGVETFQHETALLEFARQDDWRYYSFSIGKSFQPGISSISNENLAHTILKEFENLLIVHNHLKNPEVIR